MTKFTHLAMAQALAKDQRISVKNTFFGLCQKVRYTPTGSAVSTLRKQFAPDEGSKLEYALNLPADKRPAAVAQLGKQAEAPIGNYLLEACTSADRQFAALRLYQYQQLQYQPVSPLCVFTGDEALTVALCL